MPYTVRLHGIRCLSAHELDGDEVYLRFGGRQVWTSAPDRMTPRPARAQQVSAYDFTQGRKHTVDGWALIAPYNPDDFVFRDQAGLTTFQLWEDDTLSDDYLGKTPVSAHDAGRGRISTAFSHNGAHYLLTYEVLADAQQKSG